MVRFDLKIAKFKTPTNMLIGSDFNRRCEMILLEAGYACDFRAEVDISVDDIAEKLEMDRVEIRNLFRYMIDLGLIEVKSIGGPVLYGHISLTNKGLNKSIKLKSR